MSGDDRKRYYARAHVDGREPLYYHVDPRARKFDVVCKHLDKTLYDAEVDASRGEFVIEVQWRPYSKPVT